MQIIRQTLWVQNKCLDKERIWYLMVAYGCKQYTLPVLALKYVRHFLSAPPKSLSISAVWKQIWSDKWMLGSLHLLLRAIREAWAQLESRRGSSYDHLATSRPRLRKAHQQAHGGRCLTCTNRGKASTEHHIYSISNPGKCWVSCDTCTFIRYQNITFSNIFF